MWKWILLWIVVIELDWLLSSVMLYGCVSCYARICRQSVRQVLVICSRRSCMLLVLLSECFHIPLAIGISFLFHGYALLRILFLLAAVIQGIVKMVGVYRYHEYIKTL